MSELSASGVSPEARQTLQLLLEKANDAVREWRLHRQLTDSCRHLEAAIRVGESWLTPLPPAAPPAHECKPDGHVWSHQYGDDWTPEDGMLCDCRAVSWGKFRLRGAIVLRVNEERVLAPFREPVAPPAAGLPPPRPQHEHKEDDKSVSRE